MRQSRRQNFFEHALDRRAAEERTIASRSASALSSASLRALRTGSIAVSTQRRALAGTHAPFLCPLPLQPLEAAVKDGRSVQRIALQALAQRLGRHEHLGVRVRERREKREHAVRGLQEVELRPHTAHNARVRRDDSRRATAARARTCGFMCSRLVRPVRKLFPLRATNCAVSLITSRSKAAIPSGSAIVYCSCMPGGISARAGALRRNAAHLFGRFEDDRLEVCRRLHGNALRRRLTTSGSPLGSLRARATCQTGGRAQLGGAAYRHRLSRSARVVRLEGSDLSCSTRVRRIRPGLDRRARTLYW